MYTIWRSGVNSLQVTYQSRFTRFWGKILKSNFYLCKKFDISQLCQSYQSNQSNNDLNWPGFTCFVAKTYPSRITRFWGKILNSNFCLCKKFDISQLCLLGHLTPLNTIALQTSAVYWVQPKCIIALMHLWHCLLNLVFYLHSPSCFKLPVST